MSKDKFKPISDALKKALLALDETPEQHQKEKKEKLLASSTTKKLSTSSLRDLNRKVLQVKAVTREEREAEAKRLAEAKRPQFPDARVMFVEHVLCTTCGHESEGMSHPLVFLRLRSLLPGQQKFDPLSYMYVPEKEVTDFPGGKLPRIIEHHTTKVSSCPKCFTNAVHSFKGESIESSQISQEIPPSSTEGESGSLAPTITDLNSAPAEKSGIQDSAIKLSENPAQAQLTSSCASTSSGSLPPSALAEPISSLITEIKEIAPQEPGRLAEGEGR